jgi:hypothetical protein
MVWGFSAVLLLLTSGCGGGDEPDATVADEGTPPNTSRGMPVAPAEVQPQTLQVPKDADPTVILNELNRELRMWMMSNQRPPKDFEEFVSTSQIQVPPAPAGKKYRLSKEMRIELVDQ